jgi:hypothetical protein
VVSEADWTEGVVLRYGGFYGPSTSIAPGGKQLEAIRKRRFPVVGGDDGIISFLHIEDAAEAAPDQRPARHRQPPTSCATSVRSATEGDAEKKPIGGRADRLHLAAI